MTIRRFVVPVVTNNSGAAEVYSPKISGKLVSIRYVKGDYDNAVDFVITAETAGQTLWSEENVSASATRHPRAPTQSQAGVASLYAGSGEAVNTKIALADDRVKIVLANGGDTKSGTFHITVNG